MPKRLQSAFLIALSLIAASAGAAVSVTATAYPSHGLPAVPPTIVIVVRNEGSAPVHIPDGRFCIESAASPTPCGLSPYSADWGESWFDPQSAPGPFDLAAGQSRAFYADSHGIFFEQPFLNPGHYELRFRLSLADTASNTVQYDVDHPSGQNLTVWQAMTALIDPAVNPYLDSRLGPVFEANASSDYSKLHTYYADLLSPAPTAAAQLQRLQAYLGSSLPESFDTYVRLHLPGTYQSAAIELAKKGQLNEADQQLKLGRAVIQQLSASSNPYAVAASSAIGKTGPWTRADVSRFAALINGTAVR